MSSELYRFRQEAWSIDSFVDQANRLLPALLPKDASGRARDPVNQRLVRHYTTQGLVDEPLKEGREARYLYRHLLQLLVVRRLLAEGYSSAVVGRALADADQSQLEGLLTDDVRMELVRVAPSVDVRTRFLQGVRQRAGLPLGEADSAPASEVVGKMAAGEAGSGAGSAAGGAEAPSSPGSDAGAKALKRAFRRGRDTAKTLKAKLAMADATSSGPAMSDPATRDPSMPDPTKAPKFDDADHEERPEDRSQTRPLADGEAISPFHFSTWTRLGLLDGLELQVRDDFRFPTTRLGDEELVQLLRITLSYLEQNARGKP